MHNIKSNKLLRNYKDTSSNFHNWIQKDHSEEYMIFPENIGEYLSIDELTVAKGELYTFVTNKAGLGKQGSLVATIKGTKTKDIIAVLEKIPRFKRSLVKEVTLDMANNMEASVRTAFPYAKLVTDRFHVVKLLIDALQHVRINYRWEALAVENEQIKICRKEGRKYKIKEFANGDTPKQLLARSRYILAKKEQKWTETQQERATVLFEEYPLLQKVYKHIMKFRNIYELKDIQLAEKRINEWLKETEVLGIVELNTVSNTILNNLYNILNFFTNRNTNANAESFNAKIKLFRANLRGVRDTKFFLFRLKNLFA